MLSPGFSFRQQDLQEGQLDSMLCMTGEQADVRNEELAELRAAADRERGAFNRVSLRTVGF